jgi:Plant transposon protein
LAEFNTPKSKYLVSYTHSPDSKNDLNILNLYPFVEKITNGTFAQLKQQAGTVPFLIDNQQFTKMFVLVNSIYPKYSSFVRGLSQPITKPEIAFTSWHEGARKDIERTFGVIQCKWKIISFPMQAINLINIYNLIVSTCLILHNMGVLDRAMGNLSIMYIPNYAPPEYIEDTHDATNFPGGNIRNQPTIVWLISTKNFERLLPTNQNGPC